MTILSPTGSRSFRLGASAATMLAFALSTAGASTQDSPTDKRLAAAGIANLPGEISYDFDAALNTTHASYKSSLGSRSFFKRLFAGSPTVHTVIVSCDFGGRTTPALPAEIRLVLISDEYRADAVVEPFAKQATAPLEIRADGSVLRYPVSISQRIEAWTDSALNLNRAIASNYQNGRIAFRSSRTSVHVNQRATAWIPIRDFLAFVNAREVSGSVTGLDFHLSDDALTGLRRFAAAMTPVTSPSP